jgi:hypothetical protein
VRGEAAAAFRHLVRKDPGGKDIRQINHYARYTYDADGVVVAFFEAHPQSKEFAPLRLKPTSAREGVRLRTPSITALHQRRYNVALLKETHALTILVLF